MSAVRAAGRVAAALGTTPISEIAAALSFLTRLPARPAGDRTGSAAFALVGGLLAVSATWPLALFGAAEPLVPGILAVATLILVSGALHLDGLADTADALAAPDPSAAERARRDPAAGPAGIAAICIALVLDSVLVAALITAAGPLVASVSLMVAGVTSRTAPVAASLMAGAIVRPGLAAWFAERTSVGALAVCTGTSIVTGLGAVAITGAAAPLVAAAGGLLAGIGVAYVITRARRGLDGDALGAIIESTFTLCLMAALASTTLLAPSLAAG